MEHSKPWKVDPAPVNRVLVTSRLLLKTTGGLFVANYLSYRHVDSELPTAAIGPFTHSFLYNAGVAFLVFLVVFAYALDDIILLLRPSTLHPIE